MPRQLAAVGDVFLVEISGDKFAVGQVVETRPILRNSITCAFFDALVKDAAGVVFALGRDSVLSCHFVTRDAFADGRWRRVAKHPPQLQPHDLPYRETENSGWVGAKVIGSGIMTSFLKAYFGFGDWQEMKDPKYYEGLLFVGRLPPAHAVRRSSASV